MKHLKKKKEMEGKLPLVFRVQRTILRACLNLESENKSSSSSSKFTFRATDKLEFLSKKLNFNPEHPQQFGKSTWHPSNFGKTRKIGLQQFGKPTWQK
jgi:hypothetical protein